MNETLIVLIPKVPTPKDLTQFRPISLCRVLYKLLTKTIVNRLKLILPKVVALDQCSFVPGRQITNNVMIVQEVLHSMRKKRGVRGMMILKLDLEKVYDRVSWNFVLDTLKDLRLPDHMISLIMRCISTSSIRMSWNGEVTESFVPLYFCFVYGKAGSQDKFSSRGRGMEADQDC